MRSLTAAEARVVQALLAEVPGDEVDRTRRSGTPRTTYQTIRRRVLLAGWVHERYVPAPRAVGAATVTFRLAQPFAERRAEIVRRWRMRSDVTVLWASPDSLLSVTFDTPQGRADTAERPPEVAATPHEWFRREWALTCSPAASEVPVYFDYEGAWARRIGVTAPISYPQRLPAGPAGTALPMRSDLAALLARPFDVNLGDGPALRISAVHLPRRQRRLLEVGWVTHRLLPDLAEIPPFRGGRDERVVFVSGLLASGGSVGQVQAGLSRECRATPFLAAQGGGRVLLGMLSPAPEAGDPGRSSVLGFLQGALRDIEIIREPIDTLFPVIDHRYDRLLPEVVAPPPA